MENTKKQYVRLLRMYPYKFGRLVGFTKLTELHNEWMVDMINGKEDATLQAHRGSYKTTCVSIVLAILMILYPNEKIVFIRKTDTDSREIIKQTATILKSEFVAVIVRELYGIDLVVEDTSNKINTNLSNDPRGTNQLVGRGAGGSITGQHYDRIFTDDIVTVSDRVSEPARESTKSFYQELQNVKNRGGRIYNTGTPWHKEDCFTIMPNAKQYDVLTTGLISEVEQEEIKSRMLPSLYAANYLLKHIAPEDVIFTNPKMHGDPAFLIGCNYCHVDAAYEGRDYTAFTICIESEEAGPQDQHRDVRAVDQQAAHVEHHREEADDLLAAPEVAVGHVHAEREADQREADDRQVFQHHDVSVFQVLEQRVGDDHRADHEQQDVYGDQHGVHDVRHDRGDRLARRREGFQL